MDHIQIATRGSRLALWQAEHIKSLLVEAYPHLDVILKVIKTKGDKIQDVPLAQVGGKGLFVKEIEEALLDGRADIAVHSMKDVPTELPEDLLLGVIPQREACEDCIVSHTYPGLDSLPQGARVGTSSLRRQSQLLRLRPDLSIISLRGNLDTRLRKLEQGDFDAILVALAGLNRLGLSAPYVEKLPPHIFIPAVAQGALGIEFHRDRKDIAELLAFLDHPDSRISVTAERGFLCALDGGCQVPIACHAVIEHKQVVLTGLVADVKGERVVSGKRSGPIDEAKKIGEELAWEILERGGRKILQEFYLS
ncbi:MAG: hydroxymethylbilane synthase [Desulfoplanes sp.]